MTSNIVKNGLQPPLTFLINGQAIKLNSKYTHYLGHSLQELQTKLANPNIKKTNPALEKIRHIDRVTKEAFGLGVIDYMFVMHQHAMSINQLSSYTGVSHNFIERIFDAFALPRLNYRQAIKRHYERIPREILQKRMADAKASVTPEQWRQMARAREANFSSQFKRARAKKGARAYLSTVSKDKLKEKMEYLRGFIHWERRSAIMKKIWSSYTIREREKRLKNLQGFTPEARIKIYRALASQRKAIGQKAAKTRMVNMSESERQAWVDKMRHSRTSEERRQTFKKVWNHISPEHKGDWAKKYYLSSLGLLSPEQRHRNAILGGQTALALGVGIHALDHKQRKANGMKAKLAAGIAPNGIEALVILKLQEIGLYAETAATAEIGMIYYTGKHGNKRFVRFEDGRVKIPDFKVKGQPRVIEIYGNYWHGEEFCKKNKLPDYNYKPGRLIEEYAKKDIECRVYWEAEIRDIRKIAEFIQEIRGWLKTPALYSGKKLLAIVA